MVDLKKIYHESLKNIWDIIGIAQLKLGFEPTFIKTPRMALEQWKFNTQNKNELNTKKIAFFAFRNYTWIEWAVFAAHVVYKMGYQPILIFSNREIKALYPNGRIVEKLGFSFWNEVLNLTYIENVDLDFYVNENDNLEQTYHEFARDFSHTLAAYNLRVEEYEEHFYTDEYRKEVLKNQVLLMKYAAAIERMFQQIKIDRLICPSGLIGISAAFHEVTKKLNIEAIFVEGWAMRPGHMIWALNQPALIYDIKGWMKVIGEWDENKEKDAIHFLKFQEREKINTENDEWLEDFHPVQRSAKHANFSDPLKKFLSKIGPLFMLGTNVVGDSSILRRATIFKNQKEWLSAVISFFKARPELRLIIRAHPDEVWQRAKIKIGEFAYQLAKEISNIYVIKGEDNINTYSIVDYATVGLAWLSNIGLDMVLRGKPVLVAASPKYDDLGIVYRPKSREEYFQKILEYAQNPPKPSLEAIKAAKLYQRIVFKEMSLKATSKNYNSVGNKLEKNSVKNKDQEKFFKILVGELNEKGLPSNF